MIVLYTTVIILVGILIFLNTPWILFKNEARRSPKLPKKGKGTMFDVRHLLMEGEKDLAVQLYAEIFNVFLPRARKDVEELQRSLKV